MQNDLNRFLTYNAQIENRKIKCLVLMNLPNYNEQYLKTKHPELPSSVFYKKDKSFSIQNAPITEFVRQLIYANAVQSKPIVNEASINNNIDIHLYSKLSDIKSLNEELEHYGLAIVERELVIKMLVINDKK
jgi:hypothetical protein